LVEKYPNQIKVVFKNFPLRNHKMALPAALASLAAHLQGKFWPYHDKLFSSFKTLDEEKLLQFATETDLDIKQFNRDRGNPQLSQQVNNDLRLGQTVGVRGTPTVFINGLLLQKRNIADASQLIDAELKRLNQK
jgi:protein-disulfide isomerase